MNFCLLLAVLPTMVLGHAYIYFPPPRHGTSGNQGNAYCPHCLGSSSLPLPTCGQSKWLNFASGPLTTFTEGQRVKIQIKVTAHHKGHYVFRLCDRTINSSLGGLAGEEACLNQHVLERVRPEEVHSDCKKNDKRGDCQPFDEANPGYWYLPPPNGGYDHTFHYKLPDGVTCERCTLQWWWMTANSCTPHPDAYRCHFAEMQRAGWDVSKWCGGACSFNGGCPAQQGPSRQCGEQFKNCADVRIERGSGPRPPVTPKATPPPPSTAGPATTSQPEPESEMEAEEESEEEEEEESEEEGEEEGEMEKHEVRCREASGSAGGMGFQCEKGRSCAPGWPWWPCGGGLCKCSKTGDAAPKTPSPRPPMTTRAPTRPPATPKPVGRMECRANPAKIRSNGVSDSSCRRCADGYAWWPCNQADFCICSNSLLSTAETKAEARAHRFLGLIQQTDDVQRTAFETESEVTEEL